MRKSRSKFISSTNENFDEAGAFDAGNFDVADRARLDVFSRERDDEVRAFEFALEFARVRD